MAFHHHVAKLAIVAGVAFGGGHIAKSHMHHTSTTTGVHRTSPSSHSSTRASGTASKSTRNSGAPRVRKVK
jgi:hypothetical protein